MNENPETTRQDSIRDAQKQITRSLFLALAALGVIVFACYAWFVSNTSVTGLLGSVSLNGSTFELASVGAAGALDNWFPTDDDIAPIALEHDGETYWATASDKNAVLWQLNDESHLNNRAAEGERAADTGIDPGSYGTLQFYVIPKGSGRLTLTFYLQLIPMKNTSSGSENPAFEQLSVDDANSYQFLNGHLLFSYQYASDPSASAEDGFTLVNYLDKSFTLTFEVAEEQIEKPILVEMKWIWPKLLDNILTNQLHLDATGAGDTVKSWMIANPKYFFYNGDTEVGAPNEDQLNSRQYNNYFNNADQYIGDHVDAILLRMSAVEN